VTSNRDGGLIVGTEKYVFSIFSLFEIEISTVHMLVRTYILLYTKLWFRRHLLLYMNSHFTDGFTRNVLDQ